MQTIAQVLKPDFTIQERFNELKARVHDRLVEILDLRLIDKLEEQSLRQEIRRLTANILADEGSRMPLNAEERERFAGRSRTRSWAWDRSSLSCRTPPFRTSW